MPLASDIVKLRDAITSDLAAASHGTFYGSILIWDVDFLTRKDSSEVRELNTSELDGLWSDLASPDASRAFKAIGA